MKYYIIAGEASGDLHASRLIKALLQEDPTAQFRFFGGDLMSAVGGTRVKHYRELAYMGFVPVLMHLPAIFKGMSLCKADILQWKPDVVILVDYPGFNLGIAKYVHKHTQIPVYYYISPKIWAWKEWRIKAIKRDVNEMFSILPFEVPFYERKHHYKIHYVGNPTAEEVSYFKAQYHEATPDFLNRHNLPEKPIIALLAGSRKQEIKDNLPAMIEAAGHFADYQMVLACAPSIDDSYYDKFLEGKNVNRVKDETYQLLAHATAALVTSGTATLETALLGVPQVVCYETPVPALIRFLFNHVIKVPYISLVNLIAGKEVVSELLADKFRVYNIANTLYSILPGKKTRQQMLEGYAEVANKLGNDIAPVKAAKIMTELLRRYWEDHAQTTPVEPQPEEPVIEGTPTEE